MYDLKQLIEMFDLPERTIRRHLNKGFLIGEKIKNKWYFLEENIQEYFNQNKIRKKYKRDSLLSIENYINGFKGKDSDVCLLRRIRITSKKELNKITSFVNQFEGSFYFRINDYNNYFVVQFIGESNAAFSLNEYVEGLDNERTI